MPVPLRILFLGTADFAVPALQAVAQGPDQILGVVTRPDARAGRGRRLRPSPAKEAAQQLGLRVLQPPRVSGPEGLALVRDLAPDVLLVAAFGEVLSQAVLDLPCTGPINLHASLLPAYRGAAPIQRAILAGEPQTGVTAQWMVRELDAGDILLQRALPIGPDEDFGSLHERLAALAAEVAVAALGLLRAGCAPRLPQSADGVSYAPPIRTEELFLDWNKAAAELARTVRAFSPRPGARTTRAGRLLKLLAARAGENPLGGGGMPGEVVESTREGFGVMTASGVLWALRVQPEGRAAMSAADYLKGYHLGVGERLGDVS